jgi:hypothetical protein
MQPVEIEIDHRGGVKREKLADDESADDGKAERPADFRAGPGAEHQRQAPEQRRHGCHHDWPEAQQAGLIDRLCRCEALLALRDQCEINHHDGVLLDDTDQKDDGDQAQLEAACLEGEQGAETRRRQGGQDRDRVNVAFVEHAQNDVHRDDCCKDEQRQGRKRILESLGGALECRDHAGGLVEVNLGLPDRVKRPG